MRLKDKVAIVTGSTAGIGLAVVRRFLAEGAKVVANSHLDDEAAARLRAELPADRAFFFQADIADAAATKAMADAALARFGRIDVLVNNAGMDVFAEPLSMKDEQWRRCFSVDLDGAWHCAKAVLPAMLEQGAGSIVNIASAHSFKIIPHCFPYPVAKHALVGLTRALAIEYAARGIRVNAIAPGYIDTPIAEAYWATFPDPAAERTRAENIHPPKRIGRPEEVAHTALFLASDEAPFINAETIVIDGGRSALYHD